MQLTKKRIPFLNNKTEPSDRTIVMLRIIYLFNLRASQINMDF